MSPKEKAMSNEEFNEFLEYENSDHEIVEVNGVLRWKRDPEVDELLDRMNLNDIWVLWNHMGLGKNSQEVKDLYKKMGYSLYGYWEIFYWEVNNPDTPFPD